MTRRLKQNGEMTGGRKTAPPPLTPAGCDLRGMPYMPMDISVLSSDLFALSSGDEFKAALALWMNAWQEVPAASLTDDDRILARTAGYGRDVAGFRKVKAMAVRGFIKCSDGRLYHPVVAEKAIAAWRQREAQRKRARARWGESGRTAATAADAAASGRQSRRICRGSASRRESESNRRRVRA